MKGFLRQIVENKEGCETGGQTLNHFNEVK